MTEPIDSANSIGDPVTEPGAPTSDPLASTSWSADPDETIQSVLRSEIRSLECVANASASYADLIDVICRCRGRVVITGMGKSGLVGRKISATFSSTATPSAFVHPAEAVHGDLGTLSSDDLVLAISNSGETEEILALLPFLKRRKIATAALCCNRSSVLAENVDFLVHLPVDFEADPFSLVPTCTTTAMLAMGDALAVAALVRRGLTREQFAELHPSGSLGKKLLTLVSDLMHSGDQLPDLSVGGSVREAVLVMGEKRLGVAFLVQTDDRSQLRGILTDGDLRRILEKDPQPLDLNVAEVMTTEPTVVSSTMLAVESLDLMNDRQITVLPVVDDGRLVGAIHLHDLLKAGLG